MFNGCYLQTQLSEGGTRSSSGSLPILENTTSFLAVSLESVIPVDTNSLFRRLLQVPEAHGHGQVHASRPPKETRM